MCSKPPWLYIKLTNQSFNFAIILVKKNSLFNYEINFEDILVYWNIEQHLFCSHKYKNRIIGLLCVYPMLGAKKILY